MQTLTVNTKKFSHAVKTSSIFCGANSLMPVLDCVLLKVKNGKAHIMSSDTESYIASSVDTESSSGDFGFCVNGKDFNKLLSLIRDENIVIEMDESNMKINIIHSKGSSTLPIFGESEFPMYKITGEASTFSVSSEKMSEILKLSKECVGTDPMRLAMTGIFINISNGKAETCATNATILLSDSIELESHDGTQSSMLLGSKTFNGIMEVCKGGDSVSVSNHDNVAVFKCGENFAVIRKIEAKYPNYKAVIPKTDGYDKTYTFSKKDFIDAAKRCLISSSSLVARISCENGKMTMSSADIEFSKKTSENIESSGDGNIEFGVNLSYVIVCLGLLTGDMVTFKLTNPQRAILISDETEKPDRSIILMPANVNY